MVNAVTEIFSVVVYVVLFVVVALDASLSVV